MRPLLATALVLVLLALGWWLVQAAPAGPRESAQPPPGAPGDAARRAEEPLAPGADPVLVGGLRGDREEQSPDAGLAALHPAPPDSEESEPRPGPERLVLGRIIDSVTREPLGAHRIPFVARTASTAVIEFTSDAAGDFTALLPFDEYRVTGVFDLAHPEREGGLWVDPGRFHVLPDPEGAALQLTFEIRRAQRSLEVDVIDRRGAPAPDATVEYQLTERAPDSSNTWNFMGHASTDERGRAHLWLFNSHPFAMEIAAFGAAGDVSRVAHFDVGEELGIPRLQLGPAAGLDVLAKWEQQGPAGERVVRLRGPLHAGSERARAALGARATDAEGRASFGPVPPGAYRVDVENPRRGHSESSELLELEPGERRTVEVSLTVGERRLAVSGVAIAEDGTPLAGVEVHWSVEGPLGGSDLGDPLSSASDAAGRFEIWSVPSERVWLSVDVDPEAEPFEPGSIDVAFGTNGLVFQRTASLGERMFSIEARDARTRELVDPVYAIFDRGPGTEAWSVTYAPRQVYVRRVPPGLRCRLGAEGYISAALDVAAALETASSAPAVLRVDLQPGLRHVTRVFDWETGEPLEGVRFRAPGAPGAVSDASGSVHLEAEAWSVYAVERAGYEPAEWDPSDYVLFDWGPISLDQLVELESEGGER